MLVLVGGAAVASAAPWQAIPGARYADLPATSGGRPGFTLLSARDTAIAFTNVLGEERSLTNQIYHNGSGVTLGDVDGDGLCDIYFGNIDGPNALYRNLGGWKFTNIADTAGVACHSLDATGVLFADIDGDGDLDLVVNAIGRGTSILLNDGRGRFTETTSKANTAAVTGSMSAAMADIDGDGDLDLYVTNYRTGALRDEPFTRFRINMVNGKPELVAVNDRPVTSPDLVGRFTVDEHGGIVEHGEPDVLFRNEGGGRFSAVAWTNGAFLGEDGKSFAIPYEYGLSVMMRDLSGDGAPDIYVCNDFYSEDRIWINRGDGTFRLIPRLALRQTCVFSMGVDVADIDRDGRDDIFVVDMLSRDHVRRSVQLGDRKGNPPRPGLFENRPQYMRNTLFWNRGDGTYAEIAQFAGLEATEWSWTPVFLDVDLDGYEDLLVSNGHLRDVQNVDYVRRIEAMKKERKMSALEQLRLRKIFPKLENRNLAFRNRGDLRFDDVSDAWGFNHGGVKQGMALGDLDNDGDLDLVVSSLNGPALVYRNETAAPRLAVRLKGRAPNTHGVGAKIRVLGGPVPQSQEMICGGRFLSGDDFIRVFAAGNLTNQLTIEVTWRSGRRSIIRAARPNRLYEIDEAGAETVPGPRPKTPTPAPLFRDVSSLLNHSHHEEDFNDFERQPLLARKLSQSGPGVSWFDVDGDGLDDLVIGAGRGGRPAAFRNNGQGGFSPTKSPLFDTPVARDQTAILGISFGSRRTLVAGSSDYETGMRSGAAIQIYDLATGAIRDDVPPQDSSTGPLALADIEGDGDLDLFMGGRVVPGRYPEPASSLLLRGVKGKWVPDPENMKALARIGLVTSAVFSDLNDDAAPDLILACEWGPLRLFRNEHGHLVPWNPPISTADSRVSTLEQLTGWWNSVTTGDFDSDGRMDIVAGNWGENTGYQAFMREPLRLYSGDFNDDAVLDLFEGAFDPALKKMVPLRDPPIVARALPHLASRFGGYEEYGRASVMEVIGEGRKVQERSAHTLQSMLFLNRGANFEARVLPPEAQFSPVFGIGVADFNGDGHEDLLLAQNFFALDPMTSRYDGGRGLLLLGNGDGTFRTVPGQESGIAVYGEGRGVAVADYDADGRLDACIGQNGAQTKLYRNQGATPGLRVRLDGTPQNPSAIGAVLRPVFMDGRKGPAREVRAGSGWLSQDSATLVFGRRSAIRSLEVRWRSGATNEFKVPAGSTEVKLTSAGKVLTDP
jgi:enediyne biosynthesis protein E4